LYQEVEIGEAEYRQEMLLTQAKLSSLADPREHEVVTLGDNVEGVVAAWEIATKEERHDMLQMMLDAVYIDMTTKQVVGLKPRAAFLPLFNLGEPVKAGEFVLATDSTAAGLDSPPSPPRTRIRRLRAFRVRGRLVCQNHFAAFPSRSYLE
jgi:hypothetical protein